MSQINLLKQNTDQGIAAKLSPKILVYFFVFILVCLLGYYGYLFFESRNLDNKIVAERASIEQAQNLALAVPNKDELFTRQQQLKALKDLVAGHVYWTQFLKPLADVTLKTASYQSVRADISGKVSINVQVPTIQDYIHFIEVFNLAKFNKLFYKVNASGYTKVVKDDGSTAYQFNLVMDFDPSILVYNSKSN